MTKQKTAPIKAPANETANTQTTTATGIETRTPTQATAQDIKDHALAQENATTGLDPHQGGDEGARDASGADTAAVAAAPAALAARPDPKATRTYVVGSVPIRHNGEFFDVGCDIELTAVQANRLGGLVAPIPEAFAGENTHAN